MIPNYKRPQINDYIFDILERPMTDEDLEMINYLREIEKENKELKKQLEETDRKLFLTKNELDMRQKTIDNKLNQQQEFINWLEAEIKSYEAISDLLFNHNKELKVYKEVLAKCKETIGGNKDE
jgi:septal ring factor EnvC (AmiA/AmiB activator)